MMCVDILIHLKEECFWKMGHLFSADTNTANVVAAYRDCTNCKVFNMNYLGGKNIISDFYSRVNGS